MTILGIPVTFSIRSTMGDEVDQYNAVPPGIEFDPVPAASVLYFTGPWGHIITQYILLDGIQIWDTQYDVQCIVELSSSINLPFIEQHNAVRNHFSNQWEQVPILAHKAWQGGFSAGPYMFNIVLFPGKKKYRTTDLHWEPRVLIPFANAYPQLYEVMNSFERKEFAQIPTVFNHTLETKSLLHQLVHPTARAPILPMHYTGKAHEILSNALELMDPSVMLASDLTPIMKNNAEELEAIIRTQFQKELHLSSFIRQLASTEPYLQNAFKQRYGTTFHQYLINVRLEKVKQFLLDTNDDLESIAGATGFHDGPHLSNVFKKQFGETPAEFRKYRRGTGSLVD